MKPQESNYSSILSSNLTPVGMCGGREASVTSPPIQTRYQLYRRLGRYQGRSVLKSRPHLGFEPQIVEPVPSPLPITLWRPNL